VKKNRGIIYQPPTRWKTCEGTGEGCTLDAGHAGPCQPSRMPEGCDADSDSDYENGD
jgi:hypothetical protein